jgi:hypothetical protein
VPFNILVLFKYVHLSILRIDVKSCMYWNEVEHLQYSAGSALAKSAECKTILQMTQSPIKMAMVVKQPAKPYNRLAS